MFSKTQLEIIEEVLTSSRFSQKFTVNQLIQELKKIQAPVYTNNVSSPELLFDKSLINLCEEYFELFNRSGGRVGGRVIQKEKRDVVTFMPGQGAVKISFSVTPESTIFPTLINEELLFTVEKEEEKKKETPPQVWVLDANIGAGKTSILKFLKEDPRFMERILTVKEPVRYWQKYLPLFYSDPKKWGFPLQVAVISGHVYNMEQTMSRSDINNYDLVIFERDARSTQFFYNNMKLEKEEREILHNWAQFMSRPAKLHIPFISKRIFLYVPIQECYRRINIRKRNGEDGISLEYLQGLEDQHMNFYTREVEKTTDFTTTEVIIGGLRDGKRVYEQVASEILKYFQSLNRAQPLAQSVQERQSQ